ACCILYTTWRPTCGAARQGTCSRRPGPASRRRGHDRQEPSYTSRPRRRHRAEADDAAPVPLLDCERNHHRYRGHRPVRSDVAQALRMDAYVGGAQPTPIPIGLYTSGGLEAPVYLDADFLLGPEAAHLNISGVSGLATKTSAVEFLLASVFRHFPAHKGRIAAVCFNVKGPDLCFLDRPGELDAEDRRRYARLDVEPRPFERVQNFADLDALFRAIFNGLEATGRSDMWRTHHIATIRKVRNRLANISTRCKGLVTDDGPSNDLPWGELQDRTVYVVDVANVDPLGQDLVFARVVSKLREHLERRDLGVDAVVVFVDELNKYAPDDGP